MVHHVPIEVPIIHTLKRTEVERGTYIYFSNVAPSKPKKLQIKDITNTSAKLD